ncbi:DUF637 domain-containing protein [Microbulbifer sp. DLAB2-AA]|uniref:DUF637 domain-containing protein n=1 Tax=Microbulbifer sp. DLAB2-AA TaxID=3243394 RepID=UPI00403A64A7
MRFFTHLIVFFFLFQTMLPAYAVALTSGQIQQVLDSIAEIEFTSGSGSYQYSAAPYIDTAVQNGYTSIEDFYRRLRDGHIKSLGEVTYVPIGVGDITTIIPVYDNPKLVGDSFVQSRYVRDQIHELLGRHLIDSTDQRFKDEASQLKTLYDNAYLYATSASTTEVYGDPIPSSKFGRENSPYDMIWPERRVIRGETVVVPVVYLSASTVRDHKVTDHQVQINGNASFAGITLQDVAIKLGRQKFLNVAGHFTAVNSNVTACDLSLVAGGSLLLLSSQFDDCGDLSIAAGSVEAKTLVHRYDFGDETGGFFGEVSSISADGSVVVRSHSDITLNGVTVNAGGTLTFAANGNISIGTEEVTSSYDGKKGGWYIQKSGVSYLQSKLTAEETIQLIAGGQIVLDAAEIVSDQGHIELLAGLGITIEDELETTQSFKKGKFGKKKIEESIYQTVAIRSFLDAGKGISLHSEFGDITLRAADITSEDGTRIQATNGGVNLLMTTETDQYSYSSIKKGLFTVSTKNKGHVIETGVTNSIIGGLAVEALKGVQVEYEGDPSLSLDEQIQVLSQFEGMEWMAEVRQKLPNADWQAIDLAYEQWNESNTSLNAAAMAIITIVVAIVTSGAGAAMIGTTGATASGAAMNAAFTTMINTATIASANATVNGGSFEEVYKAGFEAVLSKDGVKSIAVAAATAGALSKIDAAFFEGDTVAYKEGKAASDAWLQANPGDYAMADKAFQIAYKKAVERSTLSLTQQALQAVTHATVKTGIQAGVYGTDFGDTFTQTLVQQGINQLGAHMAQKIGAAWDPKDPKDPNAQVNSWDTAMKYIAHAGSGCVIGVLTAENSGQQNASDGCVSGGAGAVIGEFTASVYRERTKPQVDKANTAIKNLFKKYGDDVVDYESRGYSSEQIKDIFRNEYGLGAIEQQITELKEQGVDLARFSAGLSVFLAGAEAAGVNTAADVGAITAENNALFIFLIPVILKAIDLALLGVDLYPIYEAYRDGGVDAGNQALADYIIVNGTTNLVLILFPGGKIGNKLISKMDENELFQAIKVWGDQLGNVAKETGDAFLTLLGDKSELALEGLKGYILRRELRDDKEGLELNGGKVDTTKYLEGLTDFYERKGDLYITKNGKKYRDTGVLEDGKPVLQSEKGSNYFYVDENGVQVSTSSPFTANVDKYRRFHNEQVDAIFIEYGKIPNVKVQKEVTVQYDNVGHEYHGMIARADLSVTGERDGSIDVPDGFELFDLNGNHIPEGKIQLDSKGRALLEVKTGNATLTSNQKIVYDACTSGQASACGANADEGGLRGQMDEIFVYILRSTKSPHD